MSSLLEQSIEAIKSASWSLPLTYQSQKNIRVSDMENVAPNEYPTIATVITEPSTLLDLLAENR